MQPEWPGVGYDMLKRNCVHFCDELCARLHVAPLPRWINRFARGGALVSDGAAAAAERARELDDKYRVSESAAVVADALFNFTLFPDSPQESGRVREGETTQSRQPSRARPKSSLSGWLMGNS